MLPVVSLCCFLFFKQKTAYEMRISDWSSDVCSSDLLEAGDLAVLDWPGDSVRPRTWQECRDLACYIGGPNPALRDDQSYSQAHYDQVCALYGDPAMLTKYSLIFVDSITVAGRLCLQWAKGQPQARSEEHTSELQSLMRISYAVFC